MKAFDQEKLIFPKHDKICELLTCFEKPRSRSSNLKLYLFFSLYSTMIEGIMRYSKHNGDHELISYMLKKKEMQYGIDVAIFKNILNLITSLLKQKRTFYFDLLEHPFQPQPTQFKEFYSIFPFFADTKKFAKKKILYVKEVQKILLKINLEMKMFIFHFQKMKRNKVYYKFRKDIYAEIFSQLIKRFKLKIDEYISEKLTGSCFYQQMELSICLLN